MRLNVLVIIDKPYDPVKLNRVADFIEKIKEPIEKECGYFIAFEVYTREEAENFHASFLDIAKGYEVVYDKEGYFESLLRRMTHPNTSMKHVKYLTTIEILKDE